VAAVAEVRMRLNGLLDEVPIAARNLARSNEQHRELIDCILADDAPGARAAMEDHLTSTSVLLRCFLESRSRRTQTTSAFS
jgi:DNA-binding FadR family transcriptional regulator